MELEVEAAAEGANQIGEQATPQRWLEYESDERRELELYAQPATCRHAQGETRAHS
jgi:hypothetical protein